ncbi:unnamed protein product [Arabidopsis arenosa]|uniref:Uncharacterized protein n=1 Tax=Arabidopsis arenosa TaxID=38785 RepID=A0A8S2AT47_ARAAE|nr:unnamed protein product [Arabidopsis arenosa]
MLLRKPISETAELRKTFADYSLISRDLGPKILIGANDKDNFRKEKDRVGSRYRVQGAFPGLYELGHDHGRKDDVLVANLGQPESIRSRLRREREVSSDAAEKEINSLPSILRLSPSRPQPVSERHDDIVDESDSASVCGVLLEDGTTCTTIPIKGRKRCAEHKGKKLSRVSPENHIPCEVPTARESKETEDTCGVILPDMVRCRRKPVSRRKRCEDHKGMRVNAFFFLLNPTERDKAVKEDKSKSKRHEPRGFKSGFFFFCEATTKNGLPCTRSAPEGSRRCWQHKDKTLNHGSSENVKKPMSMKIYRNPENQQFINNLCLSLFRKWLFGRKQEAEVGPFSAWNITGTYKDYLSKVGISGTWKFLNSVNSSSKFQDFQKEMLGIISSQVFQESARDRLLKRKLFQYGLLFSYSDLRFSCTSAPVLNEMEKHCNIEVAAQVSRVASSENNGDKNYYRMEGLMESPGGISTSRQLQASEEPVSSPLSSPALLGSGKEDEQKIIPKRQKVQAVLKSMKQVIHAALGNATHNHGLDPDRLLVVSSYTAVAKAIMVLFSPRNIIRWELEQIYETAKKEMASLERKWEEQIETTKKEIASLERKWEEQIKTCEKVDELIETCRLILEQQKKKYILISYALTEIKSMASRTGLDPQEIKEMCRNLESKQDKKSLNLSPDDNMHVEGFALSVFAKADKQDRAGRADLGTAKTFYAAAIFFETLSQFGPVPPDIEQKQKYAAWKAADIRKAIKEGRKPTPGDPVDDDNDLPIPSSRPSGSYDHGANVPPPPPSSYPSNDLLPPPTGPSDSPYQHPYSHQPYHQDPSQHMPPPQNYSAHEPSPNSLPNFQSYPSFSESSLPSTPPHYPSHYQNPEPYYSSPHSAPAPSSASFSSAPPPPPYSSNGRINIAPVLDPAPSPAQKYHYDSSYQPGPEKVAEAHKAARFAVGALAFDEVSTAVEHLKKSLELLTNPSAGAGH